MRNVYAISTDWLRGLGLSDRDKGERGATVFTLTAATRVKLAEFGFLPILIAGLWLVAAEIPALGLHRAHHRHPLGPFRLPVCGRPVRRSPAASLTDRETSLRTVRSGTGRYASRSGRTPSLSLVMRRSRVSADLPTARRGSLGNGAIREVHEYLAAIACGGPCGTGGVTPSGLLSTCPNLDPIVVGQHLFDV